VDYEQSGAIYFLTVIDTLEDPLDDFMAAFHNR
jgi:hypothetical protein